MFLEPSALRTRVRGFYGYGFAWLAERFPRGITIGAVIVGVASLGRHRSLLRDRSDGVRHDQAAQRAQRRSFGGGRALGAGRQHRWAASARTGWPSWSIASIRCCRSSRCSNTGATLAADDAKPFEQVSPSSTSCPRSKRRRSRFSTRCATLLSRARTRGMISDEDWAELGTYVPHDPRLKPLGVDDLPEQMARAFTEKDGTRGRIVYITPKEGRSIWDGRYLELLGRQLSHHRASEWRGHPWLGSRRHLRRHSTGGRRRRAQGHHRVVPGHLAGRHLRLPRRRAALERARDPSPRRRGDGRLPGGKQHQAQLPELRGAAHHLRHRRRLRGQRRCSASGSTAPRRSVE